MSSPSVARVLVESPIPRLDRLLDYSIPEELRETIVVGGRVRVPLGRGGSRLIDAFVVDLADRTDAGVALQPIAAVNGAIPVLTPALWETVRRVADRAGGGAADVLRVAIPKRTVRVEKDRVITPRNAPHASTVRREYLALDAGMVTTPAGAVPRALMQVADRARQADGGVVIVAPDWRDVALLERALHDVPHVVWDSSATPSERYARYLDVLGGTTRVVVGTRSAVFAPVVGLELLVVLNEGDPLLEEPHAPYAHARDVAIIRSEVEGGTLLFASITPSVEIARFRELGFVDNPVTRAPRRSAVILANDASDDVLAARARIPSSAWRQIRAGLDEGAVLVQVARPGFTPQVVCGTCRTPHRCASCRSLLTGRRDGAIVCRVCGATPLGLICDRCRGRDLAWSGSGSVRTAEELGRAFPGVPVVIADGDHRVLEVPAKPSLIVATRGAEPIVAGGYRAVLIVDGEREAAKPGLRTTENCLRWWGAAAHLAADDARVVVANVDGSLATAFATRQWEDLVETELRDRRALGFPPVTRAIAVRGSVVELEQVRGLPDIAPLRVLGPAVDGSTHRLVILPDYRQAPSVLAALRAHVVGSTATSIRIHADDLSVFDDVDG